MAKLPSSKAQAVNESEGGGGDFEAIPPGKYVVRLREVRDTDRDGNPLKSGEKAKYPNEDMWNVGLTIQKDFHPKVGERVLWRRYTLHESGAGMLKDFFAAFGYSADSDTDEIVEDDEALAVAIVSKRRIPTGSRKGEWDNDIKGLLPFDPEKYRRADELDDEDEDDDNSWDTEE